VGRVATGSVSERIDLLATAEGTLKNLWRTFLAQLNEQQRVRCDECFTDGALLPQKKGSKSRQN